jgi:hypothetical protein
MAKLSSELRTRIKQGRNTVSGRRRFCVEETSGLNRTSDGARAWAGAARRGESDRGSGRGGEDGCRRQGFRSGESPDEVPARGRAWRCGQIPWNLGETAR